MAYIVSGKGHSWEVRESAATKKGPRSKTLATFSILTADVLERASSRSAKPLDRRALEKAARRLGAAVAVPELDRAARELLGELTKGDRPRPVLSRLLLQALGNEQDNVSDAARSAAQWISATLEDRAAAIWDLLLLSDKLPAPGRGSEHAFPRLNSTGA